mgnify:CR=1 FL=1
MLVQASLTISEESFPVPVTGVPADAVNPFELMLVMLYVATVGVLASLPRVTPVTPSLHTVAVCATTIGSGFTATVTVKDRFFEKRRLLCDCKVRKQDGTLAVDSEFLVKILDI